MRHQIYRWQIDRRVSFAFLLSLLIQLLTLVIWATYLEARVGSLELSHGRDIAVPERLARLEERVEAVRQDVAFIRREMERK